MRIVYFAHSVLNRGGDKMVLAHLGRLAQAGHHVTLRCNLIDTAFPLHPSFTLERPLFPGKLGTLASALLERQDADLVLATIVPTAVLLRFRNRGRVLHFAQDDNETAYGFPGNLLMRWLYRLAFGPLSIPCVTVSDTLCSLFGSRFGAECAVAENGVDTARFFPAPSRELVAAKKGRRAILLLSRADRRKGFDLALETVRRVAARGGNLELWTVGESAPCAEPDLPHREFGSVDEDRLREIMSSADLFLYPSRSEGYGLMVLEAFACGCPVVTTGAVGFARDGENALVAPVEDVAALADRVERLLADRELAERLAEQGRGYASRHSLAQSGSCFEALIAGLFPAKK
ncbi:glycosyltransferase family 4 protein [Geomonas sp. Red69]|uniref:Glycosyltransferase family 4 protein n=1 Tax=Geomonas diazotrophica TaxID=2843197 RepID=A0ABX8JN90_9BACT|nr:MULTISPECIES: glycosyltransferase family 4 protein [Geomonas]MBU5636465.1 glycosyltransferase family 4 protein [Geomonas diazotrophica]QWV99032.1 glycosyltransferase family 4 protein [Geomonas nitrogeniifigens]QXE88198.1 glycosyltransferase family 4 protein [Geomonas nitrogeniifigens]